MVEEVSVNGGKVLLRKCLGRILLRKCRAMREGEGERPQVVAMLLAIQKCWGLSKSIEGPMPGPMSRTTKRGSRKREDRIMDKDEIG